MTTASNADPFAALSSQAPAPTSSTATIVPGPTDPTADPFGTPDQFGGQSGPRGPKWSDLMGRLIALKPLELLQNQPIQSDPNKTQDFWVTDLTVIGGGPITVVTPAREFRGQQMPEESHSFEMPYTWFRWYAYGAGVKVKLDGVAADPGTTMLLGVVRRCPDGNGYRKGLTPDDIDKQWAAYREILISGRDATKPTFSWGLVDPNAEQRIAALAWYRGQ